jgi:hypothetical protein
MVADPETGPALPADVSFPPLDEERPVQRRLVAIAVSPMELLRPDSDLVRQIDGAGHVDLLLACEDEPVEAPSPVGLLGGGAIVAVDQVGDDADDEDDYDDRPDEVRAAVDLLGLADLHLHRLGLRPPLGAAAEPDLVAALSELVGFDPDPGVTCVAPVPVPGDPARSTVDRVVRRIAQVYGLPVQRYRCLELAVVDD